VQRRWPVYVPRAVNLGEIETQIRKETPAADFRTIELRVLPPDLAQIHDQGLLYLPKPYVVPGGRFNEMYGWDSYFIQIISRRSIVPSSNSGRISRRIRAWPCVLASSWPAR
jgi:hypothetical protein